jgi:hypothetical protein
MRPGRFAAHTSRGTLRASLQPGASLTRRAQNNAPRARSKVSRTLPASLGARLAPTGIGATHLEPSRGGVFKTPYGAPEPRKALGERPQGRRQGCLRLPRRDRMSRRGSAGPKAAEARESLRHPGRAFFWFLFFARAKKETRPRCGEPQLGFEIARLARDTIQTLDPRFRGDDNKHGFRGNDQINNLYEPWHPMPRLPSIYSCPPVPTTPTAPVFPSPDESMKASVHARPGV